MSWLWSVTFALPLIVPIGLAQASASILGTHNVESLTLTASGTMRRETLDASDTAKHMDRKSRSHVHNAIVPAQLTSLDTKSVRHEQHDPERDRQEACRRERAARAEAAAEAGKLGSLVAKTAHYVSPETLEAEADPCADLKALADALPEHQIIVSADGSPAVELPATEAPKEDTSGTDATVKKVMFCVGMIIILATCIGIWFWYSTRRKAREQDKLAAKQALVADSVEGEEGEGSVVASEPEQQEEIAAVDSEEPDF